MKDHPQLCDRDRLLWQRRRAQMAGPEMFLHDAAAVEVQERLIDVNRQFTKVAIVTGAPEFWSNHFPNAKIVADDEMLALVTDAYDLVIHAMCLHWSNDPVGQLVQCRRALRADGFFLAVFFGGQTLAELRAVLSNVEIATTGGLSPRIAPMGEIRDVGALLQRAGLALPVADSVKLAVSYPSVRRLMQDLRAMGEGNALSQRSGHSLTRAMLDQTETLYRDTSPDGEERVTATFEMIYLAGWAPDASQQKPLRPGSAKSRLADYLETPELGEDAKPKDTTR